MAIIYNRFNYGWQNEIHSEPILDDVSVTEPDQSLSIQEIIAKFTGGILPSLNQNYYYDDDPTFDSIDPTIGNFDLVDAYERMNSAIENFKSEISEKEKEKEKQEVKLSPDKKSSDTEPAPIETTTPIE